MKDPVQDATYLKGGNYQGNLKCDFSNWAFLSLQSSNADLDFVSNFENPNSDLDKYDNKGINAKDYLEDFEVILTLFRIC